MSRMPLDERLLALSTQGTGCWRWKRVDVRGYGNIRVGGNPRRAHVVMYETKVGPIPEGMLVDHRCRNRACVNPDHLRVVTKKQNNENHSGPYQTNLSSGVRGVSWHKASSKWMAQLSHYSKKHYVGLFDSLDDAEAAVVAKRNELHTHNDLDRNLS